MNLSIFVFFIYTINCLFFRNYNFFYNKNQKRTKLEKYIGQIPDIKCAYNY